MNLRGRIIPVLDLRHVFQMAPTEDRSETRIIVVQLETLEAGLVVDSVQEVRYIDEDNIETPPSFGVAINTDFVLGMAVDPDRDRNGRGLGVLFH